MFIDNQHYTISKIGSDYSLAYNDYSAKYNKSDNSLLINRGNQYELYLSEDNGSIKYENYNLSVSDSDGLEYSDGNNSSKISNEGFSFVSGDKEIRYDDNQEIYLQYDNTKNFKLNQQSGLEANYNGKSISISLTSYPLDNTRNYLISPSELSILEGERQLF